jgi:hypothetical protein
MTAVFHIFRSSMLVCSHKTACRSLPVGILVVTVLLLAAIVRVAAQEPDKTIRDATLQFWPEYDDPGLLVIYSGTFTDTTAFPQEIAFPLPENARGIQATSRETDGRLITQQWEIVDGKLVYTLPGPGFQIEYYLDRPPSGDERSITHAFETPYGIDSLDIRVQKPARATEFSLTPPPDSSIVGDDGLTYAVVRKSNLKPGDKLDFTIRYKKSGQGLTSAPSAVAQAVPTPQPETAQASGAGSSFGTWLPYLLIGVGLLALVAAAVYWILRGREGPAPRPGETRARSLKTAPPAVPDRASSRDTVFCTQCGRQFGPDDRFCADCGTPRQR